MARCMFRYNGSDAAFHESQRRWYDEHYPASESEYLLTDHELLLRQDGNMCEVFMETKEVCNGKEYYEAIFDDGNELTVCSDELVPA